MIKNSLPVKRYAVWGAKLVLVLCMLASCTALTPRTPAEPEPVTETAPVAAATPERAQPAVRPPTPDGLGTPGFRNLPSEAMDYLRILSQAFRNKDREFLVSQGETQYEIELRSRLEEDVYMALLYRIGPLGGDSAWTSPVLPRLNPAEVRSIEFTGWEEAGPMLNISARLHMEDGSRLPSEIILVWRLIEPKILGLWP